jgi:hypothetical protein
LILVQRLFQLFENSLAALDYFTELSLLLVGEVSLWENIVDISKDIRKALDPVMQKLSYWHEINQRHSLVGDSPELIRRIDKAGTDPVDKLNRREEVTDAETKTHPDCGGIVIA